MRICAHCWKISKIKTNEDSVFPGISFKLNVVVFSNLSEGVWRRKSPLRKLISRAKLWRQNWNSLEDGTVPAEPLTKLRRKPLQLRVELAKKADSVIFSKPLKLQVQNWRKKWLFFTSKKEKRKSIRSRCDHIFESNLSTSKMRLMVRRSTKK